MQDNSSKWIGVRQSVLVSVFLSYLLNFTLQWMARQTKQQKIVFRIRNLHLKAFLHGFCGLIFCNLTQSGIYQGFMCWGVFFCLAGLHYLNLTDTDAKKRAIGDCVYYAVLICWFVGGMINYAFTSS